MEIPGGATDRTFERIIVRGTEICSEAIRYTSETGKMLNSGKRRIKNMSPRKRKAGKLKAGRASARKGKQAAKRAKPARKKKAQKIRSRGKASGAELVSYGPRGLGARSAGQSGDTQGVSSRADVDSESVEELLQEGQTFEAEALEGVENAPDPDQGEVRTRQLPEDDVPEEYREKD